VDDDREEEGGNKVKIELELEVVKQDHNWVHDQLVILVSIFITVSSGCQTPTAILSYSPSTLSESLSLYITSPYSKYLLSPHLPK
jgi:hypothetical protein